MRGAKGTMGGANLLLLLISLLVAYGLAEVFFRVVPLERLHAMTGRYYFDIEGSIYEYGRRPVNIGLKPLAISSVRTPEYATQYFINSAGYREREFVQQPRGDTIRVVVLGDSVVFGVGVEQEERFTKLVEDTLNRGGVRRRIEVLKLGVGSYSAGQSYLSLREEALAQDPDVVVFAHFANDAMEWAFLPDESGLPGDYVVSTGLWNKIHGAPEDKPQKTPAKEETAPRWIAAWAEYSSVGALLKTAFVRWRQEDDAASVEYGLGDPRNDPFWPLREGFDPAGSEAWRLHERIVEKMIGLAQSRDIPFLFVGIPAGCQVNGFEWDRGRLLHGFPVGRVCDRDIYDLLSARVRRAGAAALVLTEDFRDASSEETRLYFRYDGHLTPHGHRMAAEAIAPVLADMIDRR